MPGPPDERFPKTLRLRKRGEYLRVQRSGTRVRCGAFIGLFAPGQGHQTRLGITTTKSVGNAVVRNRLRRLVREWFRRRRGDLPPALDLVVIPYRKAAQSESAAVLENLDKLTQSILTEWERGR